jgi:hypothetical protein
LIGLQFTSISAIFEPRHLGNEAFLGQYLWKALVLPSAKILRACILGHLFYISIPCCAVCYCELRPKKSESSWPKQPFEWHYGQLQQQRLNIVFLAGRRRGSPFQKGNTYSVAGFLNQIVALFSAGTAFSVALRPSNMKEDWTSCPSQPTFAAEIASQVALCPLPQARAIWLLFFLKRAPTASLKGLLEGYIC